MLLTVTCIHTYKYLMAQHGNKKDRELKQTFFRLPYERDCSASTLTIHVNLCDHTIVHLSTVHI